MNFKKLKTTFEFTKNLFTTGALTETSRGVEIEICSRLPEGEHKVIVEYGMGHGNITREILKHISPASKVYAFEVNEKFCRHVREEIQDDRLIIINDSAEHVKKRVEEEAVDGFIASIPFTFLSNEVGAKIIRDSYEMLAPGGYYSQVLYTRFNYKKFTRIFDECSITKIPNIPTEYIYHCRKSGGE
ncbi:MAG: methyltransferase domain-containing protein [Phaeodactylibacter sp.]|nr:methyltransferase domain-containing protein [Phaeodactylibacter sp.]MCB9295397.1 methyltransferase domain-containing protein [Lewinellaceae bacterium]